MFKKNPKYYFFVFLIIIFLMYPLAYVGNQIITINQYKEDIIKLKSEFDDIILVNDKIKKEIDESKSNEFIEKMAREKLKMVKKNEIVYVMVE